MSHTRWDYASLMHQRGFRVTPQRQLILDAICEGHGHTTLEEVLERVRLKSSAVNRATVYRTLDFLCALRLVVAADMGGGRMVYEIAGDVPHHHLVCRTCGATQRISHETVKGVYTQVEHDQNFHIDMDHLALFGLCEACYAAERRAGGISLHPPSAPANRKRSSGRTPPR